MAKDHRAGSKVRGDKLPAIVMANHLLEGDVVFLAESGWTLDPSKARVAYDSETADAMSTIERRAALPTTRERPSTSDGVGTPRAATTSTRHCSSPPASR